MDLARLMPKFGKTDIELTEEQLDEEDRLAKKRRLEAGRLGPRPTRFVTNGQVRRMHAREAKAQKRKANKRYRKSWQIAEAQTANLKAQVLVVLGVTPATSAMQRNVHLDLIRRFGTFDDKGNLTNDPVEVAHNHLNAVLATRHQILRTANTETHELVDA